MHLMFMTRGVQHAVDIWKTQMQSQYFPWSRKDLKTGNWETLAVQGALRPIQLWEYIFPEPELNSVLGMLEIKPKGITEPAALNKYAWVLRKGLGFDPIPDDIPPLTPDKQKIVYHQNIHFFPIGIKKDIIEDCDFKEAGKYYQERL